MSRKVGRSVAFCAATLFACPAGAQETGRIDAVEALSNAEDFWRLELEEDVDPCDDIEADPDTIVVCEEKQDSSRYLFERPTRADTEVTGSGAPRAPNVDGIPPCEASAFCASGLGSVPPPAFMMDFDAIPETPEGSDAARLYGGPTDSDAIAEREAEEQEERRASYGEDVSAGLEDGVYGP